MKPLIIFDKVDYIYPSGVEALKDVSFEIGHRERVALLGLNGSGKSTLMLHTNGLLEPTGGKVIVEGIETCSKNNGEVRKLVGMVFQNPDDQLFMPTVWEDVAFGPKNMRLQHAEIAERVKSALKATGCEDLAQRAPFNLSGGQKKMVSIATVLSMQPKILVMDEPTTGLDYQAESRFVEIVSSLPQAFLMSTHNIDLARKLCHRAIVLDSGRIVYDGPIETLEYPPLITGR